MQNLFTSYENFFYNLNVFEIFWWSLKLVMDGAFGRMACRKDGAMSSVPLEDVAGKNKAMPLHHGWLRGAIQVGTCLGVEPSVIMD